MKETLRKSGRRNTCAGEIKGEESRWVIDMDDIDLERDSLKLNAIEDFIETLEPHTKESKIIHEIPTKSGVHIITTPFNVAEFQKRYPDIDVHKNNPTILFIP